MPFNSFEYLVFFVACFTCSWMLAGFSRLRTYFIVLASFYFYYSNNHWQILLLLFATTVDYLVCLRMQIENSPARRNLLLAISLVSNLGLLFYFKYINLFGETAQSVALFLGIRLDWVDLNVLLPVGISFYTFEALSYTIDVYRREIPAERNWWKLAFLVSFFPHLIAGPIVRAKAFFPQIGRMPQLPRERVERALFLIAAGLFKKMIVADLLAIYADRAFDQAQATGQIQTWIGVYAFSFQIFFDFSGYTDIALGSALLLGYELPQNFRRPYVSVSITEFWRRWHMTLSSWLRDYLYISLGGNRTRTRWGVYRNLIITMFLGGLWHGAAWHFALWGLLHGFILSIERGVGIRSSASDTNAASQIRPLKRLVKGALVFQLVTFLWVPFRAGSLSDVWNILERMLTVDRAFVLTNGDAAVIGIMLLAWLWQAFAEFRPGKDYLQNLWLPIKAAAYSCIVIGVLIASSAVPRAFIYFQF